MINYSITGNFGVYLSWHFFQKNIFPVSIFALQHSEQRHLYVDIGTNNRRHFAFGSDQ